ncbi:MAG: inositol monophosphatase family protein, partial [Candidatus Hinthialibacter sp.]
MKELLDFAIQTAEQAGKITLKYFQSCVKVESKKDNSPVTIADRETEDFIRTEIEKRFPDDAVLGEEFGSREGKTGFRWILD